MCKCLFGCFSKAFLVTLNVMFGLLGLFLLIVGVFAVTNTSLLLSMLRVVPSIQSFILTMEQNGTMDLISNTAIGLITLGGILFVIGFAGCYGASCGCTVCLLPYAILLLLLIACQVGVIIFALIDPSRFKTKVTSAMFSTIELEYDGTGMHYVPATQSLVVSENAWSFSWDYLQIEVSCCGSYNYTDWVRANTTKWDNNYWICDTSGGGCKEIHNAVVPLSCCKVNEQSHYPDDMPSLQVTNPEACLTRADPAYTNHEGCYADVVAVVKQYSIMIICVSAAIICIEILSAVCACFLARN